MKILLFSKSYYPVQSARALRTTELAQQFAKMGHDVTVYTVVGLSDYSQYEEKTGVRVKLMQTKWGLGKTRQSKLKSLYIKCLSAIFGRLIEFPNIELCRIVKSTIIKERDVDLLITIAMPYPIHWGAAMAKKKAPSLFPKTWISDCGDPYMGNDVFTPPFYFKYLEQLWGKMTDYITIPIKEAASAYYPEVQSKIRIIPQGLDFNSYRIDTSFTGNIIPHFAYTGTLFPGYRDLTTFLNYLCGIKEDFRFFVYTKTPGTIIQFKDKLKERLIISDYIPREQLIFRLSQMDFLINLTNQSAVQSPSKLIDYGLSKRPILDVSTPFEEGNNFMAFIRRDYSKAHLVQDIEQYDITCVAKKFLSLSKEESFHSR